MGNAVCGSSAAWDSAAGACATTLCTPSPDYSGCPKGWTSQGDDICLAPASYHENGKCTQKNNSTTVANFSGSTYDAEGKAAWAKQCDASFPETCCGANTELSDGQCVVKTGEVFCGSGTEWDSDSNKCVVQS